MAMYDFLQDPFVEHVSPNLIMSTMAVIPNDCEAHNMYEKNCGQNNNADQEKALVSIGAFNGWHYETGTDNIIMAVVDTGIKRDHEDLLGRIIEGPYYRLGWCTVPKWRWWQNPFKCAKKDEDTNPRGPHGTNVAGILGALTNNSIGMAGINWGGKVLDIGVADSEGNADDVVMARGILSAVSRGAKVINVSLGDYGYRTCWDIGWCWFSYPAI